MYCNSDCTLRGDAVLTIIGLCGGSGSGKTTAAAVMASLGAAVIDTDRVYREICVPESPCITELAGEFGGDIILSDGSLDRKALGARVFSDADARGRLNAIAHRYIAEETKRLLAKYREEGREAAVVDAPLLFESGLDALCDITIGVTSLRHERIKRIVARDGISADSAAKRIDSQLSDDELRIRCDYIIENQGDRGALELAVRSFYMNAVMNGARS